MTDGVLLREVEKVRSAVLALRLLVQLSTTPSLPAEYVWCLERRISCLVNWIGGVVGDYCGSYQVWPGVLATSVSTFQGSTTRAF